MIYHIARLHSTLDITAVCTFTLFFHLLYVQQKNTQPSSHLLLIFFNRLGTCDACLFDGVKVYS